VSRELLREWGIVSLEKTYAARYNESYPSDREYVLEFHISESLGPRTACLLAHEERGRRVPTDFLSHAIVASDNQITLAYSV
jgi:hypothetical protein